MIVVIADDFSGASEIAGIAWRYGLRSVIQTDIDLSVNNEIVIIDADTRSKKENDARFIHKSIAQTLNKSKIDWLFKKTDSVLRGHIIAEIESLASVFDRRKFLLIANNPSDGKVIRNNNYYIDDQRLHETEFKFDPEYPVKSSVVMDILGSSKMLPLTYIEKSDIISGSGIFFPEITSSEDLSQRASEIENETVPAGGSEFFRSLLEARGYKPIKKQETGENNQKGNRLFVLASTSEQSRKFCLNLQKRKVPVCNLPCSTADISNLSEKCLHRWVNDVRRSFNESSTVVSTVIHPVNRESGFPSALNMFISQMIKDVLETIDLFELLVEGGATTSHLVRHLEWGNFIPLSEYATGVVKLKIDRQPNVALVIKPGSYSWPDHFLPVAVG